MAKENETLFPETIEGFGWDAGLPDVDFFGEKVEKKEEVSEEEKKALEKKAEEDAAKKKEEEKKSEEEAGVFKDFDDEEESEKKKTSKKSEDKKEEEEQENENVQPATVVNFLIDKGILDLDEDEIKEFDELDDEDKAEVVKDYFDKAVEDRFAEGIKNLPDTVKNLIKYAVNGGNVNTFLQNMAKLSSTGLSEDMDVEDELNQEKLVRQKLQEEEYDEDYINSHIDYLKDSDKLKITAEKYFEKWKKTKAIEQEKEVRRVEAAKKLARDNEIAFKKEIGKFTSETESIKGFKLSKKDISEMPDYIASQNIRLQDGRTITPFYKDLTEAMKDKEKLVLMAKLLRNNFDFSQIVKTVDTKITRDLKESLQRQEKTQSVKSNNGSSQTQKRLVDLLD